MAFKRLITTPIFYPNAQLHCGHASTLLYGDVVCRLFNLQPDTIARLQTGLDEHGNKVYNAAIASGKEVQVYLQEHFESLQYLCKILHVNVNIWARTTHDFHEIRVQELWRLLVSKGLIYKGKYRGYYCERDETFYKEGDIEKRDGELVTKQDGASVRYTEEDCYYLRIHNLPLNRLQITPENRINELYDSSKEIGDLCISRQEGWGIPVPNDEKHVIYVWFDALLNYITHHDDPFDEMVSILGKDVLKFHGLYLPYILNHIGYTLPKLLVHNWWIVRQDKMSKSLGNVVYPIPLIEKYGYQAVRFYLIYSDLVSSDQSLIEENIPLTFDRFIVNKFANLVYRIWCIVQGNTVKRISVLELENVKRSLDELNIKDILNTLFGICDSFNSIVTNEQVWKEDKIDIALKIAGQLMDIIPYFSAILGDDNLLNIDFSQAPRHIYESCKV